MNLLTIKLLPNTDNVPEVATTQYHALAELVTEQGEGFRPYHFDAIIVLGSFGWQNPEFSRLGDLFPEYQVDGYDDSGHFAATTLIRGGLAITNQPVTITDPYSRMGYWLDLEDRGVRLRLLVCEAGFSTIGLGIGREHPIPGYDTRLIHRLVLCGASPRIEPHLRPTANTFTQQLTVNPTSALAGATISRTHFA